MKSIVFLGRSLEALPSIGPGVREIRIRVEGAWRVVYVANRGDTVYVLHAFQKKTQRTAKKDIVAIKSALKELK
jgi:phage-related protein